MPVLFFYQNRIDFSSFCEQIAIRTLNADRFIAGDSQNRGNPVLLKPYAQIHRMAINGISHYPLETDTCLSGPLKHMQGQLPFGIKLDRVSNPCLSAPLTIIGPVFWHI